MPEWPQTVLKWLAAVLGMALVVALAVPRIFDELSEAVTFGEGEEDPLGIDPDPDAGEAPPTITGTSESTGSLRVVDSVVTHVGLGTTGLTGTGEAVLIAFEPVPTDPACIEAVDLQLEVDDVTDEPEVLLQPAQIESFDAIAEGDALPADALIDVDSPASLQVTEPTTERWAATDAYALAARESPDTGVVVLALTLAPESEGDVMFVTSLGADNPPALDYTAFEDCPEAPGTAET